MTLSPCSRSIISPQIATQPRQRPPSLQHAEVFFPSTTISTSGCTWLRQNSKQSTDLGNSLPVASPPRQSCLTYTRAIHSHALVNSQRTHSRHLCEAPEPSAGGVGRRRHLSRHRTSHIARRARARSDCGIFRARLTCLTSSRPKTHDEGAGLSQTAHNHQLSPPTSQSTFLSPTTR